MFRFLTSVEAQHSTFIFHWFVSFYFGFSENIWKCDELISYRPKKNGIHPFVLFQVNAFILRFVANFFKCYLDGLWENHKVFTEHRVFPSFPMEMVIGRRKGLCLKRNGKNEITEKISLNVNPTGMKWCVMLILRMIWQKGPTATFSCWLTKNVTRINYFEKVCWKNVCFRLNFFSSNHETFGFFFIEFHIAW